MFGVGFDLFSTLFPIFFTIIFVFIIGTMIAMLVRGAKEKRKNDASPRLSVPATVVTKRTNVSHRHHNGANDMDYCTTDTTYYVTFQVESGDRMELRMSGRDYGMLFEGDRGTLHFQGRQCPPLQDRFEKKTRPFRMEGPLRFTCSGRSPQGSAWAYRCDS